MVPVQASGEGRNGTLCGGGVAGWARRACPKVYDKTVDEIRTQAHKDEYIIQGTAKTQGITAWWMDDMIPTGLTHRQKLLLLT